MSATLAYLLELHPVDATATEQRRYFAWGPREHQPVYKGTLWKSRVVDPLFSWSAELPLGDQGLGGRSFPGYGTIRLAFDTNSGEASSELADVGALFFDGRTVFLFRGPVGGVLLTSAEPTPPGSDFTRVLFGMTQQPTCDEGGCTIPLRDFAELFDVPFQTHTYLGTGELEGGEPLTGVAKPFVLGSVRNAVPIVVHQEFRVFQIHDGPVTFLYVRERGLPFTLTEVPDVFALDEGTLTGGTCYTDSARGVFRLGAVAQGVITVDATENGLIPMVPGTFTLIHTHATLMRYCVTRNGILAGVDIDDASVLAFHLEAHGVAGLYVTDATTTCGQLLDALAVSAGAQWGVTVNGKFFVRQIAFGTPVATFDVADVAEAPAQVATEPPVWRHRFQAQRCLQVLTDSDFRGAWLGSDSISSEEAAYRDFATKEYRVIETTTGTTKTHRKLARILLETGCYRDPSDHAVEAARRATFLAQDRQRWTVTVRQQFNQLQVGDTITLTYPLLGLADGQDYLITGKTERPALDPQEDLTELKLYGPRQGGDG